MAPLLVLLLVPSRQSQRHKDSHDVNGDVNGLGLSSDSNTKHSKQDWCMGSVHLACNVTVYTSFMRIGCGGSAQVTNTFEQLATVLWSLLFFRHEYEWKIYAVLLGVYISKLNTGLQQILWATFCPVGTTRPAVRVLEPRPRFYFIVRMRNCCEPRLREEAAEGASSSVVSVKYNTSGVATNC